MQLCLNYTLFPTLAILKTLVLAIEKIKKTNAVLTDIQSVPTLPIISSTQNKIVKKIPVLNKEDNKMPKKVAKHEVPKTGTSDVRKKVSKSKSTISATPKLKNVKNDLSDISSEKMLLKIKKTAAKNGKKIPLIKKTIFQIRFHTAYGQNLFLLGNHPLLGNNELEKAIPLQYFSDEYWYTVIDFIDDEINVNDITYHYILKNADGTIQFDWGNDKTFHLAKIKSEEFLFMDTWNYAGYYENTFYTEPFKQVLFSHDPSTNKESINKNATHTFRIKSPLLEKDQTLCLLGSNQLLGNWNTENPIILNKIYDADFFSCSLNLSKETFPIAYKYGVYDLLHKQFVRFEDGNNRILHSAGKQNRHTVMNDGFALLPNNSWKGAGMAIPVFGLRTESSFGIGEFSDLTLAVDWAKRVGLKMIQLLPINDTTATHTWQDSYPYAAISAFALHPIYLNLEKIANPHSLKRLHKLEEHRLRLNALSTVDFVEVAAIKSKFISDVYKEEATAIFATSAYQLFFDQNKHWLIPYAAFCYLRDQYGTVDFSKWPAYWHYKSDDIEALTSPASAAYSDIGLYYFIQFHLHLQLSEATKYAHANGIIVKGDIAIGVYRYGVDAWQNPELFHLEFQAGAPPDDFAIKGQNWGFPTYQWQRMREDGFAWWKQRFEQMSYYFDAFRIDHILGFFRIWSIPMHAVEGIMGHFVPAIPVHIDEFTINGIWFDFDRYTKPFISENVLWELFGSDNELVKSLFLTNTGFGVYALQPAFATQRNVEMHFASLEKDDQHEKIQKGLFDLISNVILFEVENSNGSQFHFRFGMEGNSSFRNLENDTQQQLKERYVNYFFRRQDDFWMKEAMQKLPALKRETNMLVCGEDLGMVPGCVPSVMRQLGLLSLEIQRMPKDQTKDFFHPNDAPYLSVVTPSTHDMSTIRGWWEEDKVRVQKFYNQELGQGGTAPHYCEAWINKLIVLQHLYSPAMWSVFQLQDLLGMDEKLRREDPQEEQINIPSNPKHYWQYRMHIGLETLLQADAFNDELKRFIQASGRYPPSPLKGELSKGNLIKNRI